MANQTAIFLDHDVVSNEAAHRPEHVRPDVTVVVTLYNYAAYIEGCLASVIASRTDGLAGGVEVLVVDDCSTDRSAALVEAFMATQAVPIRLVRHHTNRGLADARNVGLREARAPFVFILDADNEIRRDCLAEHHRALTSSEHAFAYGHIQRFESQSRADLGLMSSAPWDVAALVTNPYIDAMAMLRRDAALRVGGYSTEYGVILPQGWEDYDLWLKLAQAGHSGVMIPRTLSDYRVHGTSMIRDIDRDRLRDLAGYFTRKFHALAQRYPETPSLFGVARRELAVACRPGRWQPPAASAQAPRLVQRLLGKKLCRSICKRIARLHAWLEP